MDIGYLKHSKRTEGSTVAWEGEVKCGRRLNGAIRLFDNPRKAATKKDPQGNDDLPDYLIGYTPFGWRGAEMMCGSAWKKHSERSATDFLSLTMDDPDWSSPLNLAAFMADDHGERMTIVWNRPRGARVDREQEAA